MSVEKSIRPSVTQLPLRPAEESDPETHIIASETTEESQARASGDIATKT